MNVRNGRAWVDKWVAEGLRLFAVLVVALGISYLALSRERDRLDAGFHTNCMHIEQVRANQETVLLDILALVQVLDDRQRVGLTPVPARIKDGLLRALARIPDPRSCK